MMELARGDVEAANEQGNRIPMSMDSRNISEILNVYIQSKNYNAALNFLEEFPAEIDEGSFDYIPIDTYRGLVYQLMNETEKSRDYSKKAKEHLESVILENSEDFRVHMGLSLTLAVLGEFEKAIEHGQMALNKYPVYKDALLAPITEYRFAQVLTLAGRYDEAIDVIERVVGRRLWHTLPLFTDNPVCGPLENHPRMIELKHQYAYQYPKDN
jgi:tetratricopeptide (TPR) repeat protein